MSAQPAWTDTVTSMGVGAVSAHPHDDAERATTERIAASIRRGRLAMVVTAVVLFAAAVVGSAGATRSTPATSSSVAPSQQLAVMQATQVAHSGPSDKSARVMLVPARRPITGEKTVLPVVGQEAGADGSRWLHVRLPGRPNGHTGWIEQRGTIASTTGWHIIVHTSTLEVSAYDKGHLVQSFPAIVGKPSTPTPHGQFFIEENIQLGPTGIGAPYALALSARSAVFQEFDGGPGQIALHGLLNVGGTLGTAASHGCVRLGNTAISWLAAHTGPGVPVTITN
jgi:lipoprotein-anchoring transpeptidase ErfK/SrfK